MRNTVENIHSNDIDQLNYFDSFATYQPTWIFHRLIRCEQKIIAMFTGNQFGKTGGVAFQYVLRILGLHPIARKNVVYYECKGGHAVSYPNLPKNKKCKKCGEKLKEHKRGSKVFRFAAENLPGQSKNLNEFGMSAEVRNTQYPEFKKWLPPNLIKSDISSRSAAMIITCPFGKDDIVIDYVSYSQRVQSGAGVQRLSVWCDEEAPYDFHIEQLPRLIAEGGDMIISLTPANHITWTYDTIYERAEVYYKTKAICEHLKTKDYNPEQIEKTDEKTGIAVLQASTYDNPTLKKEIIDDLILQIDDDDEKAIRLYGIFKQVSGRIFKDFNKKVHVISKKEYFPFGINMEWSSFRACDYHPQTPWAIVFMALSDKNELFIWNNCTASPEKLTTLQICDEMIDIDPNRVFKLNLIDPLSETIKKDTISVRDDINRIFRERRKNGRGTGGHWYTWNTKGESGRDKIRERLKNSMLVGRPFNNTQLHKGSTRHLPTIWILDNCTDVIKSMQQWRWEDWSSSKLKMVKDEKNKPEQRWSHTNMAIEALCKHPLFKSGSRQQHTTPKRKPRFQRAR